MHVLNLTAGELFFEMEIEADEAEDEGDGLGLVRCGLQGEGVCDVLEDETGAAHRVDVDLVVGSAQGIHGERSVAKKWSGGSCSLRLRRLRATLSAAEGIEVEG